VKVRVKAEITFTVEVDVELDDAETLDQARGVCVAAAGQLVNAKLADAPWKAADGQRLLIGKARGRATEFAAEWADGEP